MRSTWSSPSCAKGRSTRSPSAITNYNDLNYTDGKITEEDVTGLLLEELEEDSPLRIDNTPRQRVRRK